MRRITGAGLPVLPAPGPALGSAGHRRDRADPWWRSFRWRTCTGPGPDGDRIVLPRFVQTAGCFHAGRREESLALLEEADGPARPTHTCAAAPRPGRAACGP